jgi:hypothetical protein
MTRGSYTYPVTIVSPAAARMMLILVPPHESTNLRHAVDDVRVDSVVSAMASSAEVQRRSTAATKTSPMRPWGTAQDQTRDQIKVMLRTVRATASIITGVAFFWWWKLLLIS